MGTAFQEGINLRDMSCARAFLSRQVRVALASCWLSDEMENKKMSLRSRFGKEEEASYTR